MTENIMDSSEIEPKPVPTVRDYIELMKPRIMMLVVFTAAAGLVAAPGEISLLMGLSALLAVAVGSGAAGAINMWYDYDIDAIMHRTSTRPLPAGLVARDDALALGIFMSILSVILMMLATNVMAAGLLAFSIFFYGVIYTMWLKRSTPHNIVIGGAAGAFPPVIGWAAVTGTFPLEAWALFLIVFMWTPPHFWALSLVANSEYKKAGVPMLPVTHGAKETRKQIVIYSFVLFAVSLIPAALGTGGWIYTAVTVPAGLAFLVLAIRLAGTTAGDPEAGEAERKQALGLFAYSILYLTLVFATLIIEHGTGLYVALPFGPISLG